MIKRIFYIIIMLVLLLPFVIEIWVRMIMMFFQWLIVGKSNLIENNYIANFIQKFEPNETR